MLEGGFIIDENNKPQKSADDNENQEFEEKYKALENLKEEINQRIEEMDEDQAKKVNEKIGKNPFEEDVNEENIDGELKKLEKTNKKLNVYQRALKAFEKDLDIDPGRLMGLTDGLFSIVMTLLIFGMALPEKEILDYSQFINFIGSIAPVAGLVLVSFIVLATFWIYHHEFIKINRLNMPYIWLNMFYLASVCFVPFTTSVIGNYSRFFMANIIFGLNILLVIIFFLFMFNYAHNRGFLEEYSTQQDKKYVFHTLYILMGITVIVNILDFFIDPNFIYMFLLIPIVSTIRHVMYIMKTV